MKCDYEEKEHMGQRHIADPDLQDKRSRSQGHSKRLALTKMGSSSSEIEKKGRTFVKYKFLKWKGFHL
jgi:hypothetical protein